VEGSMGHFYANRQLNSNFSGPMIFFQIGNRKGCNGKDILGMFCLSLDVSVFEDCFREDNFHTVWWVISFFRRKCTKYTQDIPGEPAPALQYMNLLWSECLCTCQIHALKSNPQCNGVSRWDLSEVIRS
jgi:hypothetical protein